MITDTFGRDPVPLNDHGCTPAAATASSEVAAANRPAVDGVGTQEQHCT